MGFLTLVPRYCAALLLAAPAMAATMGFSDGGATIGQGSIAIPIRLASGAGEAVAGFQFDIHFNPAVLEFDSVKAGPASAEAEKSAHANVVRPGQLRVVVAGFNRNAIGDGDAVLVVFGRGPAQGGNPDLSMADAILSDPFGSPLEVEIRPDTLHVAGDQAIASGASRGGAPGASGGMALLLQYRAIVFAALVVAFTMLLARTKPKKRRLR